MLEFPDELEMGVSARSTEEIYREIGAITSQFKLYECVECARAVLEWLNKNDIEGKLMRLKTKYRDEDYILSDRMEAVGVFDAITGNGVHYGIRVQGKIFDNLSMIGLSMEDWLKDFHCPSEKFVIEELDDFGELLTIQ